MAEKKEPGLKDALANPIATQMVLMVEIFMQLALTTEEAGRSARRLTTLIGVKFMKKAEVSNYPGS
jgi:hypothetical protein